MKFTAGGRGTAAFFITFGFALFASLGAVAAGYLSENLGLPLAGIAALALLWRGYAAYRSVEGAREQADAVRQVFAATASVLGSLDVNRVLRDAAASGGRLSRHASAALLFVLDESGRPALRSTWGVDPPLENGDPPAGLDVHFTDVLKTRRTAVASLPPEARAAVYGLRGFRSACILPLQGRAGMVGALALLSQKSPRTFRPELTKLEYFASQTALAIDNARLYQQVQDLFLSTIKALAAAVDAKDAYTHGHSEDIAELVTMIARELQLPPREEEKVRLAGLLHDVGKIGIPDAILRKPGKLDASERAIMMTHVTLGASIIDKPGPLQDLVAIVRHHHERYDGRGYPDGLRADEIPIGAAILAVADAFDAMTSHRAYHAARSVDEALAELIRHSGTQFHPKVVEALVRCVRREHDAHSLWHRNLEYRIQHAEAKQPITAMHQPTQNEIDTVWRLSQDLRQLEDLSSILNRIARAAEEALGRAPCAVLLLDETAQSLSVEAATDASMEKGTVIPRSRSALWRSVEQRAAQRSDDGRVICAPLVCGGTSVGVIQASGQDLGEPALRLLAILADSVAPTVQAALLRARSERAAASDELTGLLNRRALVARLHEEAARHRRYGTRFALILADIQDLSEFNARHGYEAGDDLIRRTAEILSANLRQVDLPGRLDGGTLSVVMPGLDAKEVERSIRRLHAVFHEREVTVRGQFMPAQPLRWAAASCPADGDDPDALLGEAERRLRTRQNLIPH